MHIFIATPAYNETVSTNYFGSFLALYPFLTRIGCSTTFRHSSLITRSRNELVATFMATDASHFLFWDADLGIDPAVLPRMIEFNVPVVGAPYKLKADNGGFCVGGVDEKSRKGPFVRVQRIGAGFLLIQRAAFEMMQSRLPETKYTYRDRIGYAFFDTMIDPTTGVYVSEDFAFCDRWRKCGGEVWCDTSAETDHVGLSHFKGRMG